MKRVTLRGVMNEVTLSRSCDEVHRNAVFTGKTNAIKR